MWSKCKLYNSEDRSSEDNYESDSDDIIDKGHNCPNQIFFSDVRSRMGKRKSDNFLDNMIINITQTDGTEDEISGHEHAKLATTVQDFTTQKTITKLSNHCPSANVKNYKIQSVSENSSNLNDIIKNQINSWKMDIKTATATINQRQKAHLASFKTKLPTKIKVQTSGSLQKQKPEPFLNDLHTTLNLNLQTATRGRSPTEHVPKIVPNKKNDILHRPMQQLQLISIPDISQTQLQRSLEEKYGPFYQPGFHTRVNYDSDDRDLKILKPDNDEEDNQKITLKKSQSISPPRQTAKPVTHSSFIGSLIAHETKAMAEILRNLDEKVNAAENIKIKLAYSHSDLFRPYKNLSSEKLKFSPTVNCPGKSVERVESLLNPEGERSDEKSFPSDFKTKFEKAWNPGTKLHIPSSLPSTSNELEALRTTNADVVQIEQDERKSPSNILCNSESDIEVLSSSNETNNILKENQDELNSSNYFTSDSDSDLEVSSCTDSESDSTVASCIYTI